MEKEKEKNKELIIAPLSTVSNVELFLENLDENDTLFVDPNKIKKKKNFKIIYESELADIIICKSMEDLIRNKTKGKCLAYYKKVFSNEDIDDIKSAINNGADYIIVDADNWKIIPLENIIANFQNTRTKIFTTAKNSEEVRTMFAVLELGVDGVILSTGNVKEI